MSVRGLLNGTAAQYQLKKRVGNGANSTAFEAQIVCIHNPSGWVVPTRLSTGDSVVVKIPRTDERYSDADNAEFVEAVNRQLNLGYRALKRLSDLNCVARILDFGQHAIKLPHSRDRVLASFVVEEYIRGRKLASRDRKDSGRIRGEAVDCPIEDPETLYRLAARLAENLMGIHRRQVIHGDIWYPNLMIRESDAEVVYIDFGSAVFRNTFFSGRLSRDHHRFIAPEVRDGQTHGRRRDIYALGGLLYCLATGLADPPDSVPDNDALKSHIEDQLFTHNPKLIGASPGIAGLIARCLRFRKEERVPTADALLREIRVTSLELAEHIKKTHVSMTLRSIEERARHLEKQGEDFFVGIIHAAADELTTLVSDMQKGIVEISGSHETIVSRFSMALSLLRPGDEFVTFSLPQLWHDGNFGVQGRVLDMERTLMTEGVKVRHIFLLTDSDRTPGSLADRVLRARAPVASPQGGQPCFANNETMFKLVSKSDLDSARRNGWHEGAIVRNGRVTAIEFVYGDRDTLRTLRFLRDARTIDQVQRKFAAEAKGSHPVSVWPQTFASTGPTTP